MANEWSTVRKIYPSYFTTEYPPQKIFRAIGITEAEIPGGGGKIYPPPGTNKSGK